MESILSQPLEIIKHICEFIIDEKDFVFFTMTCKSLASVSDFKPLTKYYTFSKIIRSVDTYNFINIFYDLESIRIQLMPKNLESITLSDDFNGDIQELYTLPKLKVINTGMNFSNIESLELMPDSIINKRMIILTTTANFSAKEEYINIIGELFSPDYPSYFNKKSIYIIHKKIIQQIIKGLNSLDINVETCEQILTEINRCKRMYNKKKTIKDLFIMAGGKKSPNIYDKYKIIFEQNPCVPLSTLPKVLTNFVEPNKNLIKEFIEDLQIIFDKRQLFINNYYDKILKQYNLQNINEYYELWKLIKTKLQQ